MVFAEIISTGEEVLVGDVVDTNAAWVATRLTELGLKVKAHTTVGDNPTHLAEALRVAANRADWVICSGGLGPTRDDLTTDAVSMAFDLELVHHQETEEAIKAIYAQIGKVMPEVNLRQAKLPAGSRCLPNLLGTAPGYLVEQKSAKLVFLPGVPFEMKAMFEAEVVPLLSDLLGVVPFSVVTLRSAGVGESNLQQRLQRFQPEGVSIGYRAILTEVHIKISFNDNQSRATMAAVVDEAHQLLGTSVFSVEWPKSAPLSLPATVAAGLIATSSSLAVAESCTGGLVSSMCTGLSGASTWFVEGVVTYSNLAKVERLGVDPMALKRHGSVSREVAIQMAQGIRATSGTTYGLGITGIAGPTGGTETKPIGTVYIALDGPNITYCHRFEFNGDRERVQHRSAAAALDTLRRQLQGILQTSDS